MSDEFPDKGRRSLAPLMSSAKTGGRDDWETPDCVLERVRRVWPIALDPCAPLGRNPVGAKHTFDESTDGLTASWYDYTNGGEGLVFVNYPYSQKGWLEKCDKSGCEVIALCPARTDTRAWHSVTPTAVAFWKGRLTFRGAPAPAPFPSALLYWGRNPGAFRDAFEGVAKVMMCG